MAKRVKQPHGGELSMLEKGETANPNGRPRRIVSQIIADLKAGGAEVVSPANVADAISVLIGLSKNELTELGQDTTAPVLIQRTAHRLASSSDKDWDFVIKDNLDRAHGKATQSFDHTTKGEAINNPLLSMSIEDQESFLEKINNANGINP